MAQFIRIGERLLNLDQVTFVTAAIAPRLRVYFSTSSDDTATLDGAEAVALRAYLEAGSFDVLGWHALKVRSDEEEEKRQEAHASNRTLLSRCLAADGHLWSWSGETDSYCCQHCGADSGQSRVDAPVALFGGTWAPSGVDA